MKPSESKARDANYNTFNEAALLDDLEKLTSSIKSKVSKPLLSPLLSPIIASLLLIFFQTQNLQNQSIRHNVLVDEIADDMERAKGGLSQETRNIRAVKEERDQNLCWMYVVIAVEVLIILYLLDYGL